MYFYLLVSYDIMAMCLDEESTLFGPFASATERAEALAKDFDDRDLESGEVVNVTLLRTEPGSTGLVKERSYLAEDVAEDDEDDEDDEDEIPH